MATIHIARQREAAAAQVLVDVIGTLQLGHHQAMSLQAAADALARARAARIIAEHDDLLASLDAADAA